MKMQLGLAAALSMSMMFGQAAFAEDAMNMSADQQSMMESCGCGHKMDDMMSSLKLDDAQKEKLKALKDQAKENMKANWAQMKEIRSQMDALVDSDTMDEAKVDSLINQKKELLATMMKSKAMMRHQIYTIMSPQQRTQMQNMMKQWKEQIKCS